MKNIQGEIIICSFIMSRGYKKELFSIFLLNNSLHLVLLHCRFIIIKIYNKHATARKVANNLLNKSFIM